jgi:hypothetical protein
MADREEETRNYNLPEPIHVSQMVYFRFRQHRETADQTHGGELSLPADSRNGRRFPNNKGRPLYCLLFAYQHPREKFIVNTEEINVGIGRVLSHIQNEQEGVMTYCSKTLNKAERNDFVTSCELVVGVGTLEHFLKYLYRQEFHLRTYRSTLTWLMSFMNHGGPTARSIQRLQEYNFISEHRQG